MEINTGTTQLKDQQLSAEAKSFIPKSCLFGSTLKPASIAGRHHRTVHVPCSRSPNYATASYPIISHDTLHSRPRLSATWEGPGRPPYLQNSELSNGLRSYCLSERGILPPQSLSWNDISEYNPVQSYSQHQYISQAVPDTQAFGTSHALPPGFTLLDVQYPMSSSYPAVQYGPDDAMETSGMYQAMALPPFEKNGTPFPSVHKWSPKSICAPSKRKAIFNSNQVTVGVQYEPNGQEADMQQKPASRNRTIICRDYETQTDFSAEIANKNLQTLPSPLYDETPQSRTVCENSTETDELDAEDSYSAGGPMAHWIPNNSASPYPKSHPCRRLPFAPHSNNGDSTQYLLDDASSAYLPISEDFRYFVHRNDLPGTTTSTDAGGRYGSPGYGVPNASPAYGYYAAEPVPGGFYWRPRSSSSSSTLLVETDPTMQLRNLQKRGRHKTRRGGGGGGGGGGINLGGTHGNGGAAAAAAAAADTGLRAMSSVGTDSLSRAVHEVEDEFPQLLIAADGLSLIGFENGTFTEASFVRKRLTDDQYENMQQHQWTHSTFPYGTRQIASSIRERLSKGSKKKQKRQEQLSRAADEELAQISLEQQVLCEMGYNHRRLVTPFRPENNSSSIFLSDAHSDSSISGGNNDPVKSRELSHLDEQTHTHSENSDITLEPAELSHAEDYSEPIITDADKTGQIETIICKKQEEDKEKICNRDRITELSTAVNGLTLDIQQNNTALSGAVDLSLSASSINSSMENSSSRASPVSTEMSPISQASPFNISSLTASPAGSGITSPRLDRHDLNKSSIVTRIHSPCFREYCNQILNREIDECCTQLLAHLVRFQDKVYQFESSNSLNMMKRRTVLGLREVTKHLRQSKLCCVIISPNMEQIESKGLDEALRNIIRLCEQQHVLVVYALGRHALGRALAKLVPVSVVGIFSCEGAEEHFHRLQRLTREARSAYQDLVTSLLRASASTSRENGRSKEDTGHSRTPSGCSVMSLTSSSVLSEPISENELETAEDREEAKTSSAPLRPPLGSVDADNSTSHKNNNQNQNQNSSDNSSSGNVRNGLCDGSAGDSEDSEDDNDNDKITVREKPDNYEADSECSSLDLSQNNRLRRELDPEQSRDLSATSSKGHVTQENGHPENYSEFDNKRLLSDSSANACASTALKLKSSLHDRFESFHSTSSTVASTSDQPSAAVTNPASVSCDDVG